MLASELIEQLQAIVDEFGDKEIMCCPPIHNLGNMRVNFAYLGEGSIELDCQIKSFGGDNA